MKLMKLCCSLCKTLRWFLIADDNHVAAYRSNLQFIDSQMYWFIFINRLQYVFQGRILGSKGGAVVRALASHQCGPGSTPGADAICGLSLLLIFPLLPEVFLRVLRFSLSSKTNIFKFQFDQESGKRRTTMRMCYLQIVIYLFIYLFILYYYCDFCPVSA